MPTTTDEQKAAEKRMEDDKKKLSEERADRQKKREEHLKMVTGRPTPTQEEADLIKLGHHPELAADGSTDPYSDKAMEAEGGGGGYKTRQMSSGSQHSSQPSSQHSSQPSSQHSTPHRG
jgi:hypothetical protein